MTKYFIKNLADMTPEAWSLVVENESTARKSTDGKVFLKFRGDAPELFENETFHTNEEAREILRGANWS